MKVLADTCAWSLLLRRGNPAALNSEQQSMLAILKDAIKDGRIAMVGPIRQEILSGIRETAQFERLRQALSAFPDEPIMTSDYEDAARHFNRCRSEGVGCGSIDILLCTLALRAGWRLLTNDGGIKRCLEVLKAAGNP